MSKIDLRYEQQARWSGPLRKHLYEQLPRYKPLSVLETGCGTGAVLRCIAGEIPERIGSVTAVDIDPAAARYASGTGNFRIAAADGAKLPFRDACFDLVCCHYLLLWCHDAAAVLTEMRRVTAAGGICAALAEPCYIEMEASPHSLYRSACIQREKLAERGAATGIGRDLGDLFREAGFSGCEFGRYQKCEMTEEYLNSEVRQIAEDLCMRPSAVCPEKPLAFYVPTYFAFAVK